MKSKILTLFCACLLFRSSGQTILRWDGNADGDGDQQSWNDPFNWDMDRVPDAMDDVILDHHYLSEDYTVILPSGNVSVSVLHLSIQPKPGKNIVLHLPPSNTASTAFQALGDGNGIRLDSGAVFWVQSGASSGTPVMVGANNQVRINNGAKYLHQTPRGHTNNFITRLSSEPGTEKGIIEFDVPGSPGSSYVLSGSGRNFGTLCLRAAAAGGQKSYVTSGVSRLTIRGDFILKEGADYTHNIQNAIGVSGQVNVDTGSILNLSSGTSSTELIMGGDLRVKGKIVETGTGKPGLFFKGNQVQRVDMQQEQGQGLEGDSLWIRVDNPMGIQLLTPLQVPYQFIFSSGKVVAPPSHPLIFPQAAFWVGASVSSYVNGVVRKQGASGFEFPVGEGGIYAPLVLRASAEGVESEEWEVSYHRQDPRQNVGGAIEAPLNHISQVEYWTLQPTGLAGPRVVELSVGELSFANDPNTLRVASKSGSGSWKDEGNSGFLTLTTLPLSGRLASGQAIQGPGVVTLASQSGGGVNPLPIHFVNSRVEQEQGQIRLYWQMAAFVPPSHRFQIERSIGGAAFEPIAEIQGQHKTNYTWTDSGWLKDQKLMAEEGLEMAIAYRIRYVEAEGNEEVSPVMRTVLEMASRPRARLYPNPLIKTGTLELWCKEKDWVEYQVVDMQGRICARNRIAVMPGRNQYRLEGGSFKKGIYCIRFRSGRHCIPPVTFYQR